MDVIFTAIRKQKWDCDKVRWYKEQLVKNVKYLHEYHLQHPRSKSIMDQTSILVNQWTESDHKYDIHQMVYLFLRMSYFYIFTYMFLFISGL